jgi:hypothetical protein
MIKHHYLNIQDLIISGWNRTKQHYWFLACTFLIIYILGIAIKGNPVLGIIVPLLISLSVASISLTIVNGQSFDFTDLLRPIRNPQVTLKYLVLAIACIIVVGLGILLLIIPGIYLAVRFKFFPFVVLEHPHLSLGDLMAKSYEVTEGRFWEVFFILLALGIINILAAFTVIGLLVTIPVSIFAVAETYNKLKHHA